MFVRADVLLDAFSKLRKATVSSVMPASSLVRPSACPHGTFKNIRYNVFKICYEDCKYI